MQNQLLTNEIKTATSFTLIVKWLKMILAIAIVYSYFYDNDYLIDLLVIGVVISLILPLGFFDVFIQKLIEYNTQSVEERQLLNATEANKHFERAFQKIEHLNENIKDLD
jgi:hypothetical protein